MSISLLVYHSLNNKKKKVSIMGPQDLSQARDEACTEVTPVEAENMEHMVFVHPVQYILT